MVPFVWLGDPWGGLKFNLAWWASRELRDYGIRCGIDPHSVRGVVRTFAFWRWSFKDFWYPLAAALVVAMLAA